MEQMIKKKLCNRELAKVTELNLAHCKSKNVVGLSEDWKALEKLNLSDVGLTTLKGFPRLPSLKKLEINDNPLSDGLDALTCLPQLGELDISGSDISDIDALQPLAEIGTLKKLTLSDCDVTKIKDYRNAVFKLLPSLEYLDGLDRTNEPCEENDEDALDDEESIDEEEEIEDEEDDDDEEEKDIPLEALYNSSLHEEGEEEDEDFVAEEEDDEDLDEEDGEEEPGTANLSVETVESKTRGKKRKLEDDGEKESKKTVDKKT